LYPIKYCTVEYSIVEYNIIQYSTVQYNTYIFAFMDGNILRITASAEQVTLQYIAGTILYDTIQNSTVQYKIGLYNTVE